MNIILTGFMGAGKTSVGQLLAQQLKYKFIDTDELIEQQAGIKISEIFKQKGEAYFRDLETKILESLKGKEAFVVSTGGGMVLRAENVTILKKIGMIILLWAEPDVVFERIKDDQQRPLLQVADPKMEIDKILEERQPIYEKTADLKIDTSKLSVLDVVGRVISYVQN